MSISQGRNDVRSCNADDLSMTYIETSLAIMTSTTTGFNWTATHPKCLSANIDVISRLQLGKISSQVIVVWSTMQPYVHSKGLDKLMLVALGTPIKRDLSGTCYWSENERRNQGLVRNSHSENTSLLRCASSKHCLILIAKQTHFMARKLAVLYTRPSISGLEQSVPRRAPSTSGSF